MAKLTGKAFPHFSADGDAFYRQYCDFFRASGYDTVTFEGCITSVLPYGGALAHPQPGHIDSREKLDSYPFDRIKNLYIEQFAPMFDGLRRAMPEGMRCIGGVGNGVFEIAQDLVGYENLCILSYEDGDMYRDLFVKIGDMMAGIWTWFLENYADLYCVCRFGDDLGYKSNTMLPHGDIRQHIVPQYKRITGLVHAAERPFLLHSCGNIFAVMEDLIAAGIDAKHSNEDQIAPMSEWVAKYGSRIGNFGGIDTDHLVRAEDGALAAMVKDVYALAEQKQGGLAIGSGNSIPDYVNPAKYKIMLDTVRICRGD